MGGEEDGRGEREREQAASRGVEKRKDQGVTAAGGALNTHLSAPGLPHPAFGDRTHAPRSVCLSAARPLLLEGPRLICSRCWSLARRPPHIVPQAPAPSPLLLITTGLLADGLPSPPLTLISRRGLRCCPAGPRVHQRHRSSAGLDVRQTDA